MSSYSILYSAVVSSTASTGSAGDVLIPDATSGEYVKATTANRAGRRATGIALTAYVAGGVVDIAQTGEIATSITGFTAAAASWVRCSATGTLEKVTPGAGDDLLGKVDSDGRFFLDPGKWDSTNYTSAAGTVPTGTGIPHIVGGAYSAATSLIVNADVDAAAAIAASKVVQATGTGIPHVVAGVLTAASSLIVDADVTSVGVSKITGLGAGVATALATFSSANIKTACSDETGSGGALVFATSPTLTTPVINGQIQGAAVAVAAMAIDWTLGTVFTKTLAAGANTFTFSNQASGMVITVRVTGAASTLTWPTVKWAAGAAPTQTASGIDVYTFVHDGTSIYGSVVQAMA